MAPTLLKKPPRAFTIVPTRYGGTGRLGNLTPQQEVTLQRFKDELGKKGIYDPAAHDDYLLLRFLRARKFDLALSLLMFTKYVQWRNEFQVDELVSTFVFNEIDKVAQHYPRYYHMTDRFDRPIYIEHVGSINLQQLFKVTTEERMIKHFVVGYESLLNWRLPACSKLAGQRIEQCYTILDLKGIPLRQAPSLLGFIKRISSIAQDYYPEMLGKLVIINAPLLFSSVWSMIKPFLDEVTVNKIVILGGKYQQELLKDIDPENLPKFLGGNCECDGGCNKSDSGPWKDARFNKQLPREIGNEDEGSDAESERLSR
ncbi:uncharacterized protein VTP21DRAFT_5174 [Calcarisporiella thermophila]|uniref:uncharacterized protein n=1 Tax=Calcarisporiella thermophila TaxID=911321 RepID=UPI0037421929